MALVSGNEFGDSAVLSHGVLDKWNSVCGSVCCGESVLS